MTSIRRRLTFVLSLGFAAVVGVGGVAVDRAVAARATEGLDDVIAAKLRALVALTEEEAGRIEFDYAPAAMPEYEREARPEYHQFWLDDGRVLLRSRRLGSADLPGAPTATRARPTFVDAVLPDGRPGRCGALAFVPHPAAKSGAAPDPKDGEDLVTVTSPHAVVVAVALDREELDRMLGAVRTTIVGTAVVGALLAALLAWLALARGFRPIDAIAARVASLDADRPSDRVVAPTSAAELAPVVDQLNALLVRLEAARERERRFTGSVAHELRTPIAELRSLAAVGTRWPSDATSVAGFFRDVDAIGAHMEAVVRDLLLLARCQSGAEPSERVRVGLREAIDREVLRMGAPVAPVVEVPEGLALLSDPGKLGIIVRNLVANAVGHRSPGGEVRCVGAAVGGRFRLDVRNPAAPLSRDELARLTEPFWRRDAARTSSEHAGLGLAIVAALAHLLRLDLSFAQGPDGVFVARIEGDLADPGASPSRVPPPAAVPAISRS